MLNSEDIKPEALAIIELRLADGIGMLVRELVRQSVENSTKLKFFSNFIAVFWNGLGMI